MLNENLFRKDWRSVDFSFGLIYPDIFKIGMSSYSIRLLYYLINSYQNIACERIFLPEKIKYPAHAYYDPKTQIRSIENKILLDKFDILGFSIQFENDFKNILWILEDSLIPITAKARKSHIKEIGSPYPLVIAGGPVITSNPMPFSMFFDLMFIGDSEPNLDLFFKLFKDYIHNKINYKELLKRAQLIEGIYVPSLNNNVNRAIQQNLDLGPIPDYQILTKSLDTGNLFEQKYFIEVNRGCPYQCKFCISSFHNSPFRNRSYNNIINAIDEGIRVTSFDTISLIGSCVSAHPKFYDICKDILDKGKRFSIPSIRMEHLSPKIIKILELDGIKTLTIAPETGSEPLRYALGKQISNEKIYSIVQKIKDSKIKNIKFYFLIGLPNEEEKDIEETIKMIKKINDIGFDKDSLRISLNPLIPKLNTPYENEIDFFLSENINKLKLSYQKIIKELNHLLSIKLKFQNIREIINNAKLQALISNGDREISLFLINYYLEGANFGALRKAEKMCNFTIENYFQKIKTGYHPWKLD